MDSQEERWRLDNNTAYVQSAYPDWCLHCAWYVQRLHVTPKFANLRRWFHYQWFGHVTLSVGAWKMFLLVYLFPSCSDTWYRQL